MSAAIDGALEQITTALGDLRSLITELRPAALDELGTKPALETLAARVMGQTDLEIDLAIDVAYDNGDAEQRSNGFGLLRMRDRLAPVNGTLELESAPGRGTVMRASIPTRRRGTPALLGRAA